MNYFALTGRQAACCLALLLPVAARAQIEPKTYTYKVVNGHEIKADVYRPDDDLTHPVVMYIHGGALISGSRSGVNREQVSRYLKAGFALVSIDYRLAPETKLQDLLEDVKDAHKWILAKGPQLFRADPSRVVVSGGSAGGYLTLMAGICLNPKPKALAAFYGYGDIDGPWYSQPDAFYSKQPAVKKEDAYAAVGSSPVSSPPTNSNRGRFYLYCRQNGLWPKEVTGHDPAKEPGFFTPFCPVRNVTKAYPPTILLHGNKDTDVPYHESVDMAAALQRGGVEHEFITVDGGGHGFDRAMQDPVISGYFDRALAFLRAHVR
jgi:acetyl esterase/lipase